MLYQAKKIKVFYRILCADSSPPMGLHNLILLGFLISLHFQHCGLRQKHCTVKNIEYRTLFLQVAFAADFGVVGQKECVYAFTSSSQSCSVQSFFTFFFCSELVSVRDNGDWGNAYFKNKRIVKFTSYHFNHFMRI